MANDMMIEETESKRRFSEDFVTNSPKKQKVVSASTSSTTDESESKEELSKCFHRIRSKMYLSLAPCHLDHPFQGIRQQHLDPLIMTYNPTAQGIIISYDNLKLADQRKVQAAEEETDYKYLAKVSDENPFSFVWVYVDFVVWKPTIGDKLEGYTIMQSQSHIGLLIHDVFNASIKKFYIPQDWYFVANQADDENEEDLNNGSSSNNNEHGEINSNGNNSGETGSGNENGSTSVSNFKRLGYWCDSEGVPVGGKISFTVRAIHVNGKGLAVEGTLLSPNMERDTLPVAMSEAIEDSIKDSVKKHVKFGDDDSKPSSASDDLSTTTIVDTTTSDPTLDEKAMKEALPVIEPVVEDVPVYKEEDSSSPSSASSSDDDSDSGSSSATKKSSTDDDTSSNDSDSGDDDDGSSD